MPARILTERGSIVDTGKFLTVPQIAQDAGQPISKIHYWLRYQQLMSWTRIFGRIVVERDEYARFKREHPELIKTPAESAQ